MADEIERQEDGFLYIDLDGDSVANIISEHQSRSPRLNAKDSARKRAPAILRALRKLAQEESEVQGETVRSHFRSAQEVENWLLGGNLP